jgi:hypothetical protein
MMGELYNTSHLLGSRKMFTSLSSSEEQKRTIISTQITLTENRLPKIQNSVYYRAALSAPGNLKMSQSADTHWQRMNLSAFPQLFLFGLSLAFPKLSGIPNFG